MTDKRKPAEVFPPGVYLAEELDARGVDHQAFAHLIGLSADEFNQLITGDRQMLITTADKIARMLGTSVEVWLNLDRTWRQWKKIN